MQYFSYEEAWDLFWFNIRRLHGLFEDNFGSDECRIVTKRLQNDDVLSGGWKYLVLIELEFTMVVKYEQVSFINVDDAIGFNVSFVDFAEDSI